VFIGSIDEILQPKEMTMTLKINQALIRKLCIERHGAVMGEIAFQAELAATKYLEEYELMMRDRTEAEAELSDLRAKLPSLEPLQKSADDAYERWIVKCEALDTQRLKNENAAAALHQRIRDLNVRLTQHFYPPPKEEWKALTSREAAQIDKDTWKPSLADHSLGRMMNSREDRGHI
jgi:hypothetical protein